MYSDNELNETDHSSHGVTDDKHHSDSHQHEGNRDLPPSVSCPEDK